MEKFKKIWFLFFMVLLSIPMLQNYTRLIKEKPLNGAFVPAVKPQLTLKSLWNETYQDSATKYIEENIGFHNFLVRLNNQLIFSMLRESPVKGPVMGKNGVMFEESYIISYLGRTFLGDEKIAEMCFELKTAQEIMKTKGVKLIVIFPPGKASYFPELIPDSYHPQKKERNNYESYIENLKKSNVNFIDFNKYIVAMKDTATLPIYCNLGAHWTTYAASLAMDSVIKYLEVSAGKDLADFTITGFERPDTLRNQDDDLFKTMNLMFLPSHENIAYPKLKFNNGNGKYRPRVLAISDSYWWTIYALNVAIPQNVFSDGGFWFYNKTIYPVRDPVQNVDAVNYYNEINNQEFVLLVTTEATNHLFPYDFCSMYIIGYEADFMQKTGPEQYNEADKMYLVFREKSINLIIKQINENKEWKDKIIQQAKDQNKDLNTMIYENAVYSYRVKAGVIK